MCAAFHTLPHHQKQIRCLKVRREGRTGDYAFTSQCNKVFFFFFFVFVSQRTEPHPRGFIFTLAACFFFLFFRQIKTQSTLSFFFGGREKWCFCSKTSSIMTANTLSALQSSILQNQVRLVSSEHQRGWGGIFIFMASKALSSHQRQVNNRGKSSIHCSRMWHRNGN